MAFWLTTGLIPRSHTPPPLHIFGYYGDGWLKEEYLPQDEDTLFPLFCPPPIAIKLSHKFIPLKVYF